MTDILEACKRVRQSKPKKLSSLVDIFVFGKKPGQFRRIMRNVFHGRNRYRNKKAQTIYNSLATITPTVLPTASSPEDLLRGAIIVSIISGIHLSKKDRWDLLKPHVYRCAFGVGLIIGTVFSYLLFFA